MSSHWPSEPLVKQDLFLHTQEPPTRALALSSRAYLRAEAVWKSHGITVSDITRLTPNFWSMHVDPINCLDAASYTLLTIHLNLMVGSLGTYAKGRPDLQRLMQDMVDAKALGQFCLTEVGHGLDAANLETTATLQDDGSFILHSPTLNACKYMPPTLPVLGKPCYAIIWSRLIVKGADWGVRPMLVQLNDGKHMCKGITAKLVPTRHGASPISHAITRFTNVKLPASALLGELGKGPSTNEEFLIAIWRISVGTLALSTVVISALGISSHIAYKYSCRRLVGAPSPVPIISFRTQQLPIFVAVAQTYVLSALQNYCVKNFMDAEHPFQVRHAFACIFKAVALEHSQTSHIVLSERLGAQGLFDYNQIVSQLSEIRGIVIAEGDVLVLCIRLASELLQGRYALPAATTQSLLSRHEAGVLEEGLRLAKRFGHRSEQFNDYILPRSKEIVEGIGHRMAYEAAVAEGVPQPLIDLYEAHCVGKDIGWYIETGHLTRGQLADMTSNARKNAEPLMDKFVDGMNVAPYATAPILTEEEWQKFVDNMHTFREAPEARAAL
ncbi:acyl-CoA oxidase [Cylindrobasidium torrendii FP15055 ss-10]|uniref:Acyl-CoA oxidase n=1 Tax=Cylindrobasidium torrendii FP15055 ss-10 TaxID=1314674 RepID=A0A0D7BCW3_9AGAR|nr:acyl-CoA oxidase [Cylindrobasidium torrendii FP15055 ss-10]